jgi:hypothetical protein
METKLLAPVACGLLSAMALPSASAQAAVLYTVTGSFEADTNDDTVSEVYTWAFSFSRPSFVTTLTEVAPSSCTISGTFYQCAATQTIDPGGTTFGPPIDDDYIGFNVVNTDMSGGGTSFYFFQGGALGSPGVYSNAGQPDPSGGFGNAGPATLTVATVVPEPASWALMIAGFGLAGVAARSGRPGRAAEKAVLQPRR